MYHRAGINRNVPMQARTTEPPFDPSLGADGQVLRLPMELVEMVAAELSTQELGKLRLSNRHFHAYVDRTFFDKAHFHIVVADEHVENYEKLANSESAAKIKVLKIASRFLIGKYNVEHELGGAGTRKSTHCGMTCEFARHFLPYLIPSKSTLYRYAKLFPNFANVTSIALYRSPVEGTLRIMTPRTGGTEVLLTSAGLQQTRPDYFSCVCVPMQETCCSTAWSATALLMAAVEMHKDFVFHRVTRLGLQMHGDINEHAIEASSAAGFILRCPATEHLEVRFSHPFSTGPRSPVLRQFFHTLTNTPDKQLVKLITLDLRRNCFPCQNFDPEDEVRFLESNRGTLKTYLNNFHSHRDPYSAAKLLLTLVRSEKLEDVGATTVFQSWSQGHRIGLRHILAGNLHFFDSWYETVKPRSYDGLFEGSKPAKQEIDEVLRKEINEVLDKVRTELGIDEDWEEVASAVFQKPDYLKEVAAADAAYNSECLECEHEDEETLDTTRLAPYEGTNEILEIHGSIGMGYGSPNYDASDANDDEYGPLRDDEELGHPFESSSDELPETSSENNVDSPTSSELWEADGNDGADSQDETLEALDIDSDEEYPL